MRDIMEWDRLADKQKLDKTIKALESNGISVLVAKDGEEARRKATEIIPKGSEVLTVSSTTLKQIGLDAELDESGNYNSIRKQLSEKYKDAPRKWRVGISASPDWVIGSVHAITEDGKAIIASQTGSQIPSYVYGAQRVLWIVGTQKIVKNVDEGLRRIYEYTLPLESERARKVYGAPGSDVSKLLIVNKEIANGRITVILVNEKLGF